MIAKLPTTNMMRAMLKELGYTPEPCRKMVEAVAVVTDQDGDTFYWELRYTSNIIKQAIEACACEPKESRLAAFKQALRTASGQKEEVSKPTGV